MKSKDVTTLAGLCVLAAGALYAVPASAQMAEARDKPPMYSYVGFWTLPRAQWAEMDKTIASEEKVLSKAISSGTLIAYGNDTNLIHQPDGNTHDSWWSSTSMAGVLNVLDEMYKAGTPTSPALLSATRHWDGIFVSRHYNWHPGSVKAGYTHGSMYTLKADAPDDAIDTLSKSFIVPMMEKLLADGTLAEYEIDEEAIHTQAPSTFWLFYATANAEGIDKVNAALRESLKANPLAEPAFGSMVDFTQHRDYLARTTAVYK
jgi:hypothetical protein